MSPIIEVKDIMYSYPGSQRIILDKCSLHIKKGELISILGPNGAGKSTLLNCSCGLLSPQDGTILLNGQNIQNMKQ